MKRIIGKIFHLKKIQMKALQKNIGTKLENLLLIIIFKMIQSLVLYWNNEIQIIRLC